MQFFVNSVPVCGDTVPLGVQGENLATQITADVSGWLDQWPDGQVIVRLIDANRQSHLADTVVNDGTLVWIVTAADTALGGYGVGVIELVQGDVVKKSEPFATRVITDPQASGQAPEPVPGWVEETIARMEELEASAAQSSDDAQTGAQSAQTSAQSAQTAAAQAAQSAEDAAAVLPQVETAGAAQVTAVQAAGQQQTQAVTAAGAQQVSAVQTEGADQRAAIQTEGQTQQTAIQQKGADTLASIPADYTELSGNVADLKSAIDEISEVVESVKISSTNLISGTITSGYYWKNGLNESASYNNTGYFEVEPGKTITLQYGNPSAYSHTRAVGTMRFIMAYDADKNYIDSACTTSKNAYTVPAGVRYLIISASTTYLPLTTTNTNSPAIVYGTEKRDYEPYFELYNVEKVKASALPTKALHVYLPSEICVGVGRTVELYNDLVCLEAKKYHLRYECELGVQYDRKYSITGSSAVARTLVLKIFDDDMNMVWYGTSAVRVVDNSIANTVNVIPIGDSLTNGKAWLSEVQTLSNSKIKFIGTRGRSDSTIRHEGRSGLSALGYTDQFNYTFDDNYQGAEGVSGAVNPFYDTNNDKFSLVHYVTQQGATVGTPNAVMLFLGTNDVFGNETIDEGVAAIKSLVDSIRDEYETMPIFVCNTIYRSAQSGYYSTGDQGFTASNGWAFDSDMKIMNFQNALTDTLKSYSNLYIVPLSVCMDREYDFGNVPTPVNPRLSAITIDIPSESVHPQEPGYMQIADVMYSSFIAHLN